MKKEKKFCPSCREWKDKENFALEGKDRIDKDGERKRRKFCTACVWRRRRERQECERGEEKNRKEQLVNALIELSRHDLKRLECIDREQFIERTNADEYMGGIDFSEIKECAKDTLLESGCHRPESRKFPAGDYLIIGDSHGKHTKNEMFDLIGTFCDNVPVRNIIHIGHFLDDDNDINDGWKDFSDYLTLLVKTEEARCIERKIGSDSNFDLDMVRNEIHIGDFVICNQEMITDYVRTAVSSLDQEIFPDSTITNLHRQEFDVRCSYKGRKYVMSPGCLCEKHIVKTIKQIDFKAGYQVKVSYPDGFIKYRKMKHTYEFWQQGAVVVHYDGKTVTPVPIQIREMNGKYYTSYFDKIFCSDGNVYDPDEKIFVNGDVHVPYHDDDVLEVQEDICRDYKPTCFVTIGDTYNCNALNHHLMDRGSHLMSSGEILDEQCLVEEISVLHYVLKKMGKWADKSYILYGNHERFLLDFVSKFPQLRNLIDFVFLTDLEGLGYEFVDFREVLEIGSMKFIHGDMRLYGQKGKKIEKMSRTFGECIMGHVHHSAMRFGCASVGLSGMLDQYYNEKNASNWAQGAILCNQFSGMNFVSPILIDSHKTLLNGKEYSSEGSTFSDFTLKSVKLSYVFEEEL